jgi:nitrate reductase gamma subunit
LSLVSLPSISRGSWLIDPEVFHASVHGRTSCLDCHGDVPQRSLHPDPGDIVKERSDFFSPDQCMACHDDVQEKLSSNLHGSRQIESSEKFRDCISCHDPHAQQPIDAQASRFDPSMPRHRQCGACHENRSVLPALSPEDQSCMSCHSTRVTEDPERMQGVCLHCHGEGDREASRITAERLPLIRAQEYENTPHGGLACTVCHPKSTDFEHREQRVGDCLRCHRPHSEKVAHDAHRTVSCGACHLEGVVPVKKIESEMVLWKRSEKPGGISNIHEMGLERMGEQSCERCHSEGNQVGAAAMVLPPKSVLCMPCHASTLSFGDTTTILGMVVFFAGMVLFLAPALTGSGGRSERGPLGNLLRLVLDGFKAIFSPRLLRLARRFFLDVLLQRRLFARSKKRWAIHGLIFYPFLFRFLWGLAALIGSSQDLPWEWIWAMLDKNHPLTAFLFDLTGIMLIMGVALAFIRGMGDRRMSGVPGQDRVALGLIGAVVLVGFVLEGMRIAMTGSPAGSAYAFLGYAISRTFEPGSSSLTSAYGYVWYVHAVFTGGLIAYLPFSRLLHVIIAPWVLASREEH